jgi:hypothetical protein
MDDLNAAKKRTMANMKRQNKGEIPYATTVSDAAELSDFVEGLQFVNSEMYDIITALNTDPGGITTFSGKFGPILNRIQTLGKQASGLDFSHFSVFETNEIKQLRDYISTNNENFKAERSGKTGSRLMLNALDQLTNQVDKLLTFIDLKLQQPYNLGPLQGGYLLPRHLL